MSDDVVDVFEEHERSEIRGTLLGVSRMTTMRVARRTVDVVDPYTREVRLWVKEDMSLPEIKSTMLSRLGMSPMQERGGELLYEIKYGSKYSQVKFSGTPIKVSFISS